MPAPVYICHTSSVVALAAATAKTVVGVKAHANSGLLLRKVRFTFDGTTATAVPVTVEVGYCTWATNSPGTNSTSITPFQANGRPLTVGFTAGKTWTTEPTVITAGEPFVIPPTSGAIIDIPLGDEWDCALGEGFVIRCTAAAIVDVMPSLYVSRC